MQFFASSQIQTFRWWAVTKELLASLLSSFWIVLWNFPGPSFLLETLNALFTVLRSAFNNFCSLKKCLLLVKAESSLAMVHMWSWPCSVRLAPRLGRVGCCSGVLCGLVCDSLPGPRESSLPPWMPLGFYSQQPSGKTNTFCKAH